MEEGQNWISGRVMTVYNQFGTDFKEEMKQQTYWLGILVQPADIGWPTGNGKKLSCSQAQLGQATCLAVASFLSISCGPTYVRRLYIGGVPGKMYREHQKGFS